MAYGWRSGLGDVGGVQALIESAAARYGVPASIAVEVARKESSFSQAARGSSGEIGVFQLLPGTASDLHVNPFSLDENIDGGVRYLGQLYARFGDWVTALQAYNGGPGNVQRGTVSTRAQAYAVAVLNAAGLGAGDWSETGDGWGETGDGADFLEIPSPASLSTTMKVSLAVVGFGLLLVAVSD